MTAFNKPEDTFTSVVLVPVSFTYAKGSKLHQVMMDQTTISRQTNERIAARTMFLPYLDKINDGATEMIVGLPVAGGE